MVARFGVVELSEAMLLALARRGSAKVNSKLICDYLVLFILVQSMFLQRTCARNELCR